MSTTLESTQSKDKPTSLFSKWDLVPNSENDEQLDLKKILHHFFVEFNPLYLISALCIFYGVFMVANNLQAIDQASTLSGEIILFLVLQVYEATIIAGIAFLVFKAQSLRPAIILCLLECTLIFDCTFRLESLSLMGNTGIALFCVWFVLVLIKSWLIAKIMRLEMNWIHYSSIAVIALSIAVLIELFSQTWINQVLLLQIAAWIGAFVLLSLVVKRPAVISKLLKNVEDLETAKKCINAGFTIMAGFYFYHTLAFMFFAADTSVTAKSLIPQLTTLTLLLTIVKSEASEIIKYAILTVLLGLTAAIGSGYACFIIAAILVYHVLRGLHNNYLILATALCYAGFWLLGWSSVNTPLPTMPELISLPSILFGLSLLMIGIFFKNVAALCLIVIALCYVGFNSIGSVLPTSELGQGILIISSGFIALISGLAINWWLRLERTNEGDVDYQ